MEEITLRNALDEFLELYARLKNYAERTRTEYQNDIADMIGFLEGRGITPARSLSLNSVDRYLGELDVRGLAGSTRKRKTVTIRMFLAFLFREGYITNDIGRHLIIPFADIPAPRILMQNEQRRLLEACSGNIRDTAIIETFLQTGVKLSEFVGLTVSDIDFQEDDSKECGPS